MTTRTEEITVPVQDLGENEILKQIARALHGLRYGAVEITLHAGRVVQIERREKVRLEQSTESGRQSI